MIDFYFVFATFSLNLVLIFNARICVFASEWGRGEFISSTNGFFIFGNGWKYNMEFVNHLVIASPFQVFELFLRNTMLKKRWKSLIFKEIGSFYLLYTMSVYCILWYRNQWTQTWWSVLKTARLECMYCEASNDFFLYRSIIFMQF